MLFFYPKDNTPGCTQEGIEFSENFRKFKNSNAFIIDMRFIKPIDREVILKSAENHSVIVTVEDNSIMGGAGSAVNEVLSENSISSKIINVGTPDKFFNHATREQQLHESGISKENIIDKIQNCIENNHLYDLNHSSNID